MTSPFSSDEDRLELYWKRASLVPQTGKNPPAVQETWVQSLGWEDPLEEGMATHSSILAWRISWTEEPGGPLHRVAQSWTPWSDLARMRACTEVVYRAGSFELLILLVSRCRCGWRWNEIARHFPNHLISVYLLPSFEDPRKYFTYIIHFSPHSNPWREVSLSPNTLTRHLRVPEVWQSCLMSLKLDKEPGLEPRAVCLQEMQFSNCLWSPSFWTCLSTRSMLSLKYFGGGDMATVTFSGYGSRSPLKHDFDGSLLVCLLEKVTKMSFIHVKSETEAR